ncbi:hypothetical protein D3C77_587900 [compost metagenome]
MNCDSDESEQLVHSQMAHIVKRYNVKQKTVSRGNIEMTLEVRLRDGEGRFVNQISELGGVKNAVLISFNGDYVS